MLDEFGFLANKRCKEISIFSRVQKKMNLLPCQNNTGTVNRQAMTEHSFFTYEIWILHYKFALLKHG